MKLNHWIIGTIAFLCGGILVAAAGMARAPGGRHLIAKGDVLYASFSAGEGKVSGWTSINESKAVPGGNGSWNEHRYAEVYENYMIVTKPGEKGWGALVIPTSQLVEIHFLGQ